MAERSRDIDVAGTERLPLQVRRRVLHTRVADSAEGKRICKKLLEEFTFEGYTPIEIASIQREDLAETFNEGLRYARIGTLSRRIDEENRMDVPVPPERAAKRKAGGEAVQPSIANTFLAIAALAITGAYWAGLNIGLAGILGAAASTLVAATVQYHRTRDRTRAS